MARNLFLSLLLFFSSFQAFANCKIQAEAVIGFLDFEIEGCSIEGDLIYGGNHISGTFSVDLTKLDSGLSLRNDHMKNKYLEVSKFPKAFMKVKPITIGADHFKGDLTLHGVTKEVKGNVLASSKDMLRASFSINITDFGIEKPGYKGVVVGETINIFVALP